MPEVRFIKSDFKQRYTLGVVYEPNAEDSQGDFTDTGEIEKACHDFMMSLQGKSTVTKAALQLLDSIVKSLQNGDSIDVDVTDVWDDITKADNPLGFMHEDWSDGIGDIVECYIAPVDFQIGDEQVKKGTWLLGCKWSSEYFKKIECGELTGLSMGGSGKRIPVKEVV